MFLDKYVFLFVILTCLESYAYPVALVSDEEALCALAIVDVKDHFVWLIGA